MCATIGAFDPFYVHPNPSFGVQTHPGFHTTGSIDIAALYAELKFNAAVEPIQINDEDFNKFLSYPVVVGLDMQDLAPLLDYDTAHMLIPVICDLVSEVKTYDDLVSLTDMQDFTIEDIPETAIDLMVIAAGYGGGSDTTAFFNFIEHADPEYGEYIFDKIKEGRWDAELYTLAMSWMDQYRYTSAIESDRVLSITYYKPFYSQIVDPDATPPELLDTIESYGFDSLTLEDMYDVYLTVSEVYRVDPSSTAIVQYHGTGYVELLGAFPELTSVLPVPPSPFNSIVPDNLYMGLVGE